MVLSSSKPQQKRYHFPQFCVGMRADRYLRIRLLARSGSEAEGISELQISRPHPCSQGDHYGQRGDSIFRMLIHSHFVFSTFSNQRDIPHDPN